ncbi:unnamed protein product [Mytilus edulis]|uniref:Integrase zinc-binding domain-containing protein n=1 Tax=Mytilus edulis TaxID=6550 RepID=A0A8S3QP37_MYTED|nr:unnamed protein product [Mytilus edulis]
MVSAVSKFVNKTGLLMAHGLVKPENGVIPLRLMNLTNKICKVKKNTITAIMENVENKEIQIPEQDIDPVFLNNINTSDELPVHLVELYENSSKNLNEEEKCQFMALLIKYQDAFSKDPKDIGTTNLVEHTIDTGDARPIRIPPRRLPFSKLKMAEEEILEMAKRDIIEPGYGPWSFPVVLITQPKLRFTIDYRGLNFLTYKDSYPLPRIDDTLDALSGASLFSVLDLRSDKVEISKQIDFPGHLSKIPVVDESKIKNNLSVCAVTRSQTKKGDNSEIPGSSGISTKLTGEINLEKDISLSDEQRQDPVIGQLFKWKLDGHRPEWKDVSAGTVELKHYWSKWDSIVMKNNIVYQKWENDTVSRIVWQVLLPFILRKTALKYLHNAPSSGHLGIKKTLAKLR